MKAPLSLPKVSRALQFLFAFAILSSARANVTMPSIFGDHMVLQKEMKIPVWGWANPGEDVTVTFAGQRAATTADDQGNWRVDLDKTPANASPQTLTVTGRNTIAFHDVLIGDVWLAAGQSNMEMGLSEVHNAAQVLPTVNDPMLRFFNVETSDTAIEPRKNVPGTWRIATLDNANRFSGAAYFFIHEIRKDRNIPIGLLRTGHGGTGAQTWLSVEAIKNNVTADPEFQSWLDTHAQLLKDYPARLAVYTPLRLQFQKDHDQWRKNVFESPEFTAQRAAWEVAAQKAREEDKNLPPRPVPPVPEPKEPDRPEGDRNKLANVYNAKLFPMIPYAIKGAIWYQGESNSNNAKQYRVLFPLMIKDWREKWGEGDFPFIYVQLPNLGTLPTDPDQKLEKWVGDFVGVREAQAMTLALPNTGMAVAIDLGDPRNVHPKDKMDVGYRLSLVARKVAYGEDIVYTGPTFESMKVEGNKVRITFDNVGTGLVIGTAPWTPSGKIPPLATELRCFTIAGADKKWAWAKATIEGNDQVVVSSDTVPNPVAVRYDWFNSPNGNLYNREKLPAAPFRTDNWEL